MFHNLIYMKLPKIIGHRGAKAYAPENTLAGMRVAKEKGARWVEFDVMRAADGELVCFHDRFLHRLTDTKGRLDSKKSSVLTQLDVGKHFSPEFAGERLPTLAKMLQCLAKLELGFNLQFKVLSKHAEEAAERLLECLDRYWPSHLPAPLISSHFKHVLAPVRHLDNKIALAYLEETWGDRQYWLHVAEELQCYSVHLYHPVVTSKRIQQIHNKGFKVLVYTINSADHARQLFDWGVDTIISDYPDLLRNKP